MAGSSGIFFGQRAAYERGMITAYRRLGGRRRYEKHLRLSPARLDRRNAADGTCAARHGER